MMRRTLAWLLVATLLGAAGCGACRRAPQAPEQIPEKKMSVQLRGILCSIVIDMATGASGFRRVYTPEALERAQRKTVTIDEADVDWTVVLDQVTERAEIDWAWRQHGEEWILWLHVDGEEWDPASLGL